MGWTFTTREKGETVRAFFEKAFNYRKEDGRTGTIIESSVQFRTAYFAFKITSPGKPDEVVALVCLLDYRPSEFPYDFGYKDMDETMGPNESKCPERILKLLTPTTSTFANTWRLRCWDAINKKKAAPKIKKYQWVKFEKPIRFRSGDMLDTLQFIGRSIFQDKRGLRFRLNRDWRSTDRFQIIEKP